jgi:peroxiredoxin
LLSDVDRLVGRAYGVERGPDEPNPLYPKRITFIIDPEGVIAQVYEVSDAGAHPAVVLEDLGRMAPSA